MGFANVEMMLQEALVITSTIASREAKNTPAIFPPLEEITRPNLTTKEVAYYTNMKEQTWREYACYESGPIRPVRIGNRLNWPTSEVRKLVGVA